MLASLERAREGERRFVADASHELRTPLTALRGNAAYVARHGADQEVLADLEADAARLARMLDDLLALAREDAAHRRPRSCAWTSRRRSPPDASASSSSRPSPSPCGASRPRSSARWPTSSRTRSATARGTAMRVSVTGPASATTTAARGTCSSRRRGTRPGARAGRAGLRALLAGPGARGEGSGLGLALVRTTAERHGGRVEVDGARFTLVLPALRDLSEPGRRNGRMEHVRSRVARALALADETGDPAWLRFAVVDGGQAGIDLAGEIAELIWDPRRARISLLLPDVPEHRNGAARCAT